MARKYGKDTQMWRLYEKLFLEEQEPDRFDEASGLWVPSIRRERCSSHGEALNYAMGLNGCQIQDFAEKGTPKSWITKSAKAKEDEHGVWWLEISVSYRHRAKPGKAGSLGDRLLKSGTEQSAIAKIQGLVSPDDNTETAAPIIKPPTSDKLYEDMFMHQREDSND